MNTKSSESQGQPGGARVHGIKDESQVCDQIKQDRILHQHQRIVLRGYEELKLILSAKRTRAAKLSRYRPDVQDVACVLRPQEAHLVFIGKLSLR